MRMPLSAALVALALSVPPGRYSREDYEDSDREVRPDYRFPVEPQSPEVIAENKRLSDAKQKEKDATDILLTMLRERYPKLSGKALRKKLKELRREHK